MLKSAVFIDRDGVINKNPREHHYIVDWDEFIFLPRVKEAIKLLNKACIPVIVITNQAGISKGIFTTDHLEKLHVKMKTELEEYEAHIQEIYYCPHKDEDKCKCRKPNTDLLHKAAKRHKIDLAKSYFVGDSVTDIQAGRNAGCKTVFIKRGRDTSEIRGFKTHNPSHIAEDLHEAVEWILSEMRDDAI